MVNLMARLGGRGRHNGANAIVHLAREVVGRRRTIQNATQEARNAIILDSLADEDFRALDTTIGERTSSDRDFAQTLARLTYAAARAKGFDRCVVDAALRLDSLIPEDDPAHERDRLLRDAYSSAQKASYIRGGRLALGRLGRRAVEADDLERARVLLHQQLDLGPEKDDTPAEVDSALVLGDILRRDGDDDDALAYYRRAATAAERLEYRQGVAQALLRQVETNPSANLETVAALQRQALDAAQRTGNRALEGDILVKLADTLAESDRLEDATPYYQNAREIAQEISDLTLEARCVTALAHAHRRLGHALDAMEAERSALAIEERLGNRPAAASWALSLGTSELRRRNADAAVEAFDRARLLGGQIGDATIQQRAEGNLGIAHTLLGHGPETINHLSRAIDLARQGNDLSGEAQWVSSLGQAYWMFKQIDDAIRVLNEAISLAEETNNVAMQAESFALLGQIYASERETIRARDCFTRALQLSRDLGQTADQVTTLTALGTLAANTGQYTQAGQLFEQAMGLALSMDDRPTATALYGRMGSLAQKRNDLRSAIGHYQRAVELAQTTGDARLLSRTLQHLATAQDVTGDPAAVASYERAVIAADDAGDVRGGITMRLNMGMLISRLPEAGAEEDAIGWLSDAANYAMEAGADYTDLRKQAEQQIQALGGGATRSRLGGDHPPDTLQYRDEGMGRGAYRDIDERAMSSETRDDEYDDDDQYDDYHTDPYDADRMERPRLTTMANDGVNDDDVPWDDEPYDDEPYPFTDRQGPADRSGYDDRSDGYRDEPVPARADYGQTNGTANGYARHDDSVDQFWADEESSGGEVAGDGYEVDPYADHYDDRNRPRPTERYDYDGYDREPSRAATRRSASSPPGNDYDVYDREPSRGQYDDPDQAPVGRRSRGGDDDRYAATRMRRDVDADDEVRAGTYRDRDAGGGFRYDDDRDDRYDDSEPRYRDEPVDRHLDADRPRRGASNGRREPMGASYGDDRYDDRYDDRHDDRYDDDFTRGYAGPPEGGRDYYGRPAAGRQERNGRRDNGSRERSRQALDDEPSEPGSGPARRRPGLGGMFARTARDTRPGRRRRAGRSTRLTGGTPPLTYGDQDDRDGWQQ